MLQGSQAIPGTTLYDHVVIFKYCIMELVNRQTCQLPVPHCLLLSTYDKWGSQVRARIGYPPRLTVLYTDCWLVVSYTVLHYSVQLVKHMYTCLYFLQNKHIW